MRKSVFIFIAVVMGILVFAQDEVPRVMRVFYDGYVVYESNVAQIDYLKFENEGDSGDSDTSYLIPDSVYTEILSPDVSFNMVKVKGGKFVMGAQTYSTALPNYADPEDLFGNLISHHPHNVILSDFFIGETEITRGVWEYVMGAHELSDYPEGAERVYLDPAYGDSWGKLRSCQCRYGRYPLESGGSDIYPDCSLFENNDCSLASDGDYPVYYVSYEDITAEHGFLDRLNALTGKHYCLPTEAQWEYAARGGQKNRYTRETTNVVGLPSRSEQYQYSGSNILDDVGWDDYYYDDVHHPVKTKQPNELGIYDMSGNVGEWCADWFHEFYYYYCADSISINPTGPSSSSGLRVVRFGVPVAVRGFFGFCYDPLARLFEIGFRVALVP